MHAQKQETLPSKHKSEFNPSRYGINTHAHTRTPNPNSALAVNPPLCCVHKAHDLANSNGATGVTSGARLVNNWELARVGPVHQVFIVAQILDLHQKNPPKTLQLHRNCP